MRKIDWNNFVVTQALAIMAGAVLPGAAPAGNAKEGQTTEQKLAALGAAEAKRQRRLARNVERQS